MTVSTPTQAKKRSPVLSSDWEWDTLGNLFDFRNGMNADKASYGFGVKFINVMEVIYNESIVSEIVQGTVSATPNQLRDFEVKRGDVLFNRTSEVTSEVGLTAVYQDDAPVVFGGFVIRGRPKDQRLNDDFNRYCFRISEIRKQIIQGGQGVVRSNIGQAELEKIKIRFPSKPEQQSIALVLMTIDGVLSKTQALIAQKELRKKGLMQRLLTGKKRLPGYSVEWKRVNMNTLFQRITRKNDQGCQKVVTISGRLGFVSQTDYFNKVIASDILDNYFLLRRGEFSYNKSYSNGYPWGAIKRLKHENEAVVTTLYICFGIHPKAKVSASFMENFFESGRLNQGLMRIAHEGGRAHGLLNVVPDDFFNLDIRVPAFEEQEAIAGVLDVAEKEIQLLRTKAARLRDQKKGLMQVLLTGKKRLKAFRG